MKKLKTFVSVFFVLLGGTKNSLAQKTIVEQLGLKGIPVSAVVINDSGHILASAGNLFNTADGYIWRSTDGGKNWVQFKKGLEEIPFGIVSTIAIIDSGYLLAGSAEDVFKSTDNGESWRPVKFSGNLGTERRIRPRKFLRKSKIIFACGFGSGFWRSDDNGWNWQQVSLVDWTFPYVQTIALTPSGVLFAGIGSSDKGTGVFRSTDDGKTWAAVNGKLDNGKLGAYSSLNIRRLAYGSGILIAITEVAGIYRTDDEGENWYKVEKLPIFVGDAAVICPLGIFVTGYSGIDGQATYRSVDNGASWEKLKEMSGDVVSLFLQVSRNKLLVCTGDGLLQATFDSPTDVKAEPQVPEAFVLKQNYPNPFNPTTTIEFALPERSFVKLTIMNILGEEVETVLAEAREAGSHRIIWNASRYPSGTYFYRLETSRKLEVGKMVLLK